MRAGIFGFGAAFALLLTAAAPAAASPWAEVGDAQMRADMELLNASGVIRNLTMTWPLPWQSIQAALQNKDLRSQTPAVRAAAHRLLAKAQAGTAQGFSGSAYADFTNRSDVIYGFDGMGRGDGQAQLSLGLNSGIFSGRVSLGAITNDFGKKPNKLMADGTYFSARLGDALIYAGYLDHWWGPGQLSSLQLSNNARPMPQIGFERASTAASSWPLLRWVGPWQFEFFLAKFDGPQIQSNVYYNGAHLTISPLAGLELGIAKTEQFCGQGHPCSPLRDYFTNFDFSNHPDNVNGQGSFELKYSTALGSVPFQVYAQMMNEDYSFSSSSGSSHLFGASIFVPTAGSPVKLTAEFTDSIATRTPFSFGNFIYGYTYTNGQYPDGTRYRDRTLGFSLDTDSTLTSLQGSWSDAAGRFYELSLHHATIANRQAPNSNILTSVPVLLNQAEARVSLPLMQDGRGFRLDLAGRVQDDQPRPHNGFAVAVEVALRAPL
jgi:Capsule assembly protein Wzi